MDLTFPTLRQRVSDLEAHPWGALALRFLLAFLLLYPWGWRFTPVSFRPEDIDPVLLEACKAEGIDLFNPALWAHSSELWMRWGWILLGLTLGWWLLSRSVRFLQRRFGLGWSLLPVLVAVPVFLAKNFRIAQGLWEGLRVESYSGTLEVWGGWLQASAFTQSGLAVHLRNFGILVLLVEALMAAGLAQRFLEETRALALRASLTPHFLYNALNTLTGLVEEDPKAAQSGMERLGRLLRRLLESSARPRHALGQELAFVEDYLGLERARLGDRLKVTLDIPEDLSACAVPVLGLQVLVENAIKHAVAPRAEGGELRIDARREGRWMVVSVTDPGTGLAGTKGLGQALHNLRNRLGRPKDLRLERLDTGHRASFRVPCEVA